MEEELQFEYWLASIRPLTDKKKRRLKAEWKKISAFYYIEEKRLQAIPFLEDKDICTIVNSRKNWNVKKEYEKLCGKKIQLIPFGTPGYPEKLTNLQAPPYALYVKGRLPSEEYPSVAIVGARKCSPYGEMQTKAFTEVLTASGIQIISGMARGVDGIAQNETWKGGGSSFGVLACGVDICYPREHIELYMELQKKGGIISEQPPGTAPLPQYFPARNRIISGIADVVLVMEARAKSGSLITADMALEQGKDVYVLPGPINSPLSQGCNALIAEGAGILLSPEDLLKELEVLWANKSFQKGELYEENTQKSHKNKIMLENTEKLLYSYLDLQPKNLNQLICELRLPAKELMNQIISLEMKGLIREISKNYYVKI